MQRVAIDHVLPLTDVAPLLTRLARQPVEEGPTELTAATAGAERM
jgi:hypothetical protein